MLDNFIFSVNVVLPLFLCCVVGCAARQLKLVDEAFIAGCSHVVFYIAIPANIFLSIAGSDLYASVSLPLMGYVLSAILVLFAVLTAAVPRIIRERPVAATAAICMFRSNFAMLGIPLAISLMGPEGAVPTMVMVPFATLLYTALTVAILAALGQSRPHSPAQAVRSTLWEILRNPLIAASLASILVAWLHIPLPAFLTSTVGRFADMCTGLSLFMLGAQLNVREVRGRLRCTVSIAIVRLAVIPLVVVTAAAALGFRGGELACVFIFFAAPTAVNCYILAGRMGGDGKLAGDAVLLTSCLSTLTLMAGIFLLRSLGLL